MVKTLGYSLKQLTTDHGKHHR